MKHFSCAVAVLCALMVSGCRADEDNKTITQLQSEIEQKQAAIERIKINGNYKRIIPEETVCINGVLYYEWDAYGAAGTFAPAVNPSTMSFMHCTYQ